MQPQSKSQHIIVDIDKLVLKFTWRGKRPQRANTILKKNKVGELTTRPHDYGETVIRTVRYW